MAELILLNRIRGDIGEYSGSLSELLSLSSLKGFNDNYEPQAKPRLVGTWTINDWYTTDQLAQVQDTFDGLTIVEDPNWLINFDDLAVQVIDNTKPNYNPAVAILMHGAGFGKVFNEPVVTGQEGRWILLKADAAKISSFSCFAYKTDVVDTECIVSKNADTYSFEYFPEFEYFTGVGVTGTAGNPGTGDTFCYSTKLKYIKTPPQLSTFGYCTFMGISNSCIVDVLNSSTARLQLDETSADFRIRSNSYFTIGGRYYDVNHLSKYIIIYVGTGNKYKDLKKLQEQVDYQPAAYSRVKIKTWYDYTAPHLSFDDGLVTMSVERPSTIYYTTDGTTPTVNSTQYTEPFNWDSVGVIKAMAIQTIDNVDDIAYADDFYAAEVETPVISYNTSANQVVITSNTSDATIYYTLDGTHPTLESFKYSGPIDTTNLGDIVKVRCFATKEGMNDSDVINKICVQDDSLWGTDSETSSFAVQCMDSAKPNYNPAVCIILDNNNKLTDKLFDCGGYLSKSDAGNITTINTWFKGITSVVDNKQMISLIPGTYDFDSFRELKYFTGINTIVVEAFAGCSKLGGVLTIPSNVTSLPPLQNGAPGKQFSRTAITKLIIEGNITSTCGGMCYNCGNLIEVVLPNSVTRLFGSDFANCNNLTTINIPTNLARIGAEEFSGCRSLTNLTLPQTVYELGTECFKDCTNLVVNVPQSLTTLKDNVFNNCYNLTGTITLPGTLTNISAYAPNGGDSNLFRNTGINKLILEEGITIAPSGMCGSCNYLSGGVELPSTITNIYRNIFGDASVAPAYLWIKATTPPTLGGDIKTSCKIYVGDGTSAANDDAILQTYLNDTTWSAYSTRLDTWYNYLHPSF